MNYLRSASIKNNKVWLEQLTLSVFPMAIVFLTPILTIQYFRSSSYSSKILNWIIWIFFLIILNVLPVILYCSYVGQIFIIKCLFF